mgnify:CR=1 FL=1
MEDILNAKIAELEGQLENINAEKEAAEAKAQEAEAKVQEGTEQLAEIMTEVKNLKKMTAGDEAPPKKVVVEPKNKFDEPKANGHQLDGFAKELFRNIKSN